MTETPKSGSISLTQNFGEARPVLSKISSDYMLAADTYEFNKIRREQIALHRDEVGLLTGNLTTDQVSRTVTIPLSILRAQEEKQKRDKRAVDDQFMFMLLSDMRKRLDEIERSMAELREELSEKYGEDVTDGLAETFLTDEEYAGLETDDEKFRALADKMLDENGDIKEQYAHLKEARYIKQWNDAEQLRGVLNKHENSTSLDANAKQEISAVAVSVGLAGQDNMYVQTKNAEIQETVEQVMETTRKDQELVKTSTVLAFK